MTDKPEVKIEKVEKPELTKEELQNIINMIATHSTPEGVGSAQGQYKIQLINKCTKILELS